MRFWHPIFGGYTRAKQLIACAKNAQAVAGNNHIFFGVEARTWFWVALLPPPKALAGAEWYYGCVRPGGVRGTGFFLIWKTLQGGLRLAESTPPPAAPPGVPLHEPKIFTNKSSQNCREVQTNKRWFSRWVEILRGDLAPTWVGGGGWTPLHTRC